MSGLFCSWFSTANVSNPIVKNPLYLNTPKFEQVSQANPGTQMDAEYIPRIAETYSKLEGIVAESETLLKTLRERVAENDRVQESQTELTEEVQSEEDTTEAECEEDYHSSDEGEDNEGDCDGDDEDEANSDPVSDDEPEVFSFWKFFCSRE